MARGWESKDVGEQQARERVRPPKEPELSAEDKLKANRLRALQLDHERILHEIDATGDERFRRQLRAALEHLERQIAALTLH